jgi:hypothetical protein
MRQEFMNAMAVRPCHSAGLFVTSPVYATAGDCDGIASSGGFSRFRAGIKDVGRYEMARHHHQPLGRGDLGDQEPRHPRGL